MAGKTRYPDRLGHADYLTFFLTIINFKEREVAAGTWPAHLSADLNALHGSFESALKDYDKKRKYRIKEASPALDDATLPLYKRILSLKEALPTLFDGDETVLAEFGIAGDIPSDRDELFLVASNCVDHWNALCTPDPPVEYEPAVPFFDDLLDKFPAFTDARLDYINALRDEEEAQDLVLATREACNHEERLIFHWYCALWLDPEDENWTHTPWGTSSGGSGGGDWPKKPVGKMSIAPDPLDGILAGCEEYDGTKRFDLRIVGVKKNDPVPEMPLVDTYTDIEQPALLDADGFPLQKNFVYYLWIRARKDGEVSDWSEVVGLEWTE